MTNWLSSLLNNFGLIGLPYAALALFVFGFVHRYRHLNRKISSHSTQFLERDHHFWASVPLHYGILAVFLIHLCCWLLPTVVLWWDSSGLRLAVLEVLAAGMGVTALVGLGFGVRRRLKTLSIRRITSPLDWAVYLILGFQFVTGILTALFHPWGTAWMAAAGAPFLRSILLLNPDPSSIVGAPLLIRLHVVGAFLLLGLLPFSRLSHILVLPLSYFWRAPLAFRWRGKERLRERP